MREAESRGQVGPGGNGESRLLRLLLAIARGGTIEEIAGQAGIPVEEARILVSALASQGYIARPGGSRGCPCNRCPLRGICGGRIRARGGDAFMLTEEGRRLLHSLLQRRQGRARPLGGRGA